MEVCEPACVCSTWGPVGEGRCSAGRLGLDRLVQGSCLLTCTQAPCSGPRRVRTSLLLSRLFMEQLDVYVPFLQRRLMQILPDGPIKKAVTSMGGWMQPEWPL